MNCLSFFFIISILFTFNAYADQKLYTEDDLEGYDYGNGRTESAPDPSSRISHSRPMVQPQSNDAEAWCNRMTRARDRVKNALLASIDAGSTARGVQETYGRKYIGGSAATDARIEYNKSKDELRAAEDDVRNIEEEAHRKGIPPGWLECNY